MMENIGILVTCIGFLIALSLPGMFIADIRTNAIRAEVINDLCNQNQGKYDFCVLDSTTYTYTEKKKDGN